MNRSHNLSIAERYLSKNKKYYSYETQKKDKENIIIDGDIDSIIQKLTYERRLPQIALMNHKRKYPLSVLQNLTIRKSLQKSKLSVNSIHFFQQDQYQMMLKKDLKKEIQGYINKIRTPMRSKCSLYQEYLLLSQQTNDYLQYYLTNFTGEDPGKATQLLKEQGKTIILLILRKKYKCFQTNPIDITNRIFLSFNLNPLNDFQFISWEKFMRIRKLISGDFNRKDYTDFLTSYFFTSQKKSLTFTQFWLILASVMRKLDSVLDISHLETLLGKIKTNVSQLFSESQPVTEQKFQKKIQQEPMFIWHQFTTLAFL